MGIGVWGASITYGECDSEGLGWVGRLRRSLVGRANVYNFGVCGDTSADVLKRFAVEADSIDPDIIMLSIGMNDSKFVKGETASNVSLIDFEENVKNIIRAAKTYTDQMYIVGLTRVANGLVTPRGSQFKSEIIEKYDVVLKKVADGEGIPFISVFNVIDPEHDLAEGLHPNAKGYEKLFNAVSSKVVMV